eukprot:365920-Chlamydomonas_euryale.AAC.24
MTPVRLTSRPSDIPVVSASAPLAPTTLPASPSAVRTTLRSATDATHPSSTSRCAPRSLPRSSRSNSRWPASCTRRAAPPATASTTSMSPADEG